MLIRGKRIKKKRKHLFCFISCCSSFYFDIVSVAVWQISDSNQTNILRSFERSRDETPEFRALTCKKGHEATC